MPPCVSAESDNKYNNGGLTEMLSRSQALDLSTVKGVGLERS